MSKSVLHAIIFAISTALLCVMLQVTAGKSTSYHTLQSTSLSAPLSAPLPAATTSSENPEAVVLNLSQASQFQHQQQSPVWTLFNVSGAFLLTRVADAHYYTEALPSLWLIAASPPRDKLAGWKDASLQFKIKNAFV